VNAPSAVATKYQMPALSTRPSGSEGAGIPFAVTLAGGHRNDVTQLLPLIEAIPAARGRRARRRPEDLYADRGYEHDKYRRALRAKGITRTSHDEVPPTAPGLGKHRRVIEQTIALPHRFRRLRIGWEIRDDIHEAFMSWVYGLIRREWRPSTEPVPARCVLRSLARRRPAPGCFASPSRGPAPGYAADRARQSVVGRRDRQDPGLDR
jgi:hypothetical protein